ncbi:MAG: hypothetical protein JJU11_09575, partial [Candidatus Sumerlaeia bacterium]|nr:hypothetical protein [Candidatus Sumerlaeia bacterium]
MMRFRPILVLLLLLLAAPLMAEQDQLSRQEARDILREELRAVERAIGLFVRGDIPAFREYLAPIGQQRYTEDQMERAHGIMERMFGGHRHTQAAFGTSPPLSHATRGAIVPIDLRNGEVDIHIGWSGNFGPGTISYFRIATRRDRPSHATPPRRIRENQEISSPPYVYPDLFKETEIKIPRRRLEDGRALLAVPNAEISARRLPAALIIGELHSYGPDSARGYLRPLRDIAQGLASQGVVTLRIEPRNPRDRGWELESHRLSDMREGLRYLYNHDRVDPAKIYIVGHEIGGIMAAALAREIKLIAGVVLVGTPHSWTPQAEQTRSQKWHDLVGYPTEEELAVLRGERSLLRDGQMPPTSLWS